MRNDLPVYDYRPGTRPTLVFLHYWGGSARTWRPVVYRLPGREVLCLDFRGWSRSKALPGPYTLARYAEDVRAILLDAAVDDVVLVGHSMGGKVAQLVAARRPAGLRGLVLVAPAPAVPSELVTPEYRDQLSHAYDTPQAAAFARDRVLTAAPLPEPLGSQVLADSRSGTPAAVAEWPRHGIAEDVSAQARQIDVPTLVVAGEHDVVEPAEVLRSNLLPQLRHGRLVVLRGTGHLVPLEVPDALAKIVGEFADRVRSDA